MNYLVEPVNHPVFDDADPETRRQIVLLGLLEYQIRELIKQRDELIGTCVALKETKHKR